MTSRGEKQERSRCPGSGGWPGRGVPSLGTGVQSGCEWGPGRCRMGRGCPRPHSHSPCHRVPVPHGPHHEPAVYSFAPSPGLPHTTGPTAPCTAGGGGDGTIGDSWGHWASHTLNREETEDNRGSTTPTHHPCQRAMGWDAVEQDQARPSRPGRPRRGRGWEAGGP